MVNAFRSGIDRQKVPSPLLRRAAAMKSQSMDAGGSSSGYDSYSNLFHFGGGFGRGSSVGSTLQVNPKTSGSQPKPTGIIQPFVQSTFKQSSSYQSSTINDNYAMPGPSGLSTFPKRAKMAQSDSTDLDGLQDDQIEALLRSETEDLMEDFDDRTENSVNTVIYNRQESMDKGDLNSSNYESGPSTAISMEMSTDEDKSTKMKQSSSFETSV